MHVTSTTFLQHLLREYHSDFENLFALRRKIFLITIMQFCSKSLQLHLRTKSNIQFFKLLIPIIWDNYFEVNALQLTQKSTRWSYCYLPTYRYLQPFSIYYFIWDNYFEVNVLYYCIYTVHVTRSINYQYQHMHNSKSQVKIY